MERRYRNTMVMNYMESIKKSVGSGLFQNYYVDDPKEKKLVIDVCEGGEKSCALYVSRICLWYNLVRIPCVTVDSLLKEMKSSGWNQIPLSEAPYGAVVVWEPRAQQGRNLHRHVGFVVGTGRCVSHIALVRAPAEHDLFMIEVYGNKNSRRPQAFYSHPFLIM